MSIKKNKFFFSDFSSKIIFTIIVSILFPLKNYSQAQIDFLIKDGLRLSYNFQMESASEIYDNVIKKFPEDPRGYQFKALLYLWKYLSNGEQNDFETFINYSDAAIEKSKELLNEKEILAKYLLGSNYGYRAIAFGKAGKQLDMIWASKNSNLYLTEVIEKNPNYFDAYLGLGLFKFALSQVPASFKWALNIIGFNGDQELGLRYLKLTAGKGDFSKVEAEYYLANIYSEFLFDYEKSSSIFRSLSNRFPQNILFQYSLAVNNIKIKDLKNAEKIISAITKSKNPYFKTTIAFSFFLMGDINYKKNYFTQAINYYEHFINQAKDKDYKSIAAYRLGICFEMMNDRTNSIKYFEMAKNINSNIEDDLFAKRKSEIYFNRTIADEEKSLIVFTNMIDNAQFKAAYDSLINLSKISENEFIKVEASLYLSDVCYELKKYDESSNFAEYVFQFKNGSEKWIKPMACYYSARANIKKNDLTQAKAMIKKYEEYSDYDYSSKIKKMIKILEEKIN